MPINRDTPPTLANQATDALAEKTASVLIRHAEGQLQELMSLQKKIGERQSSLVILMKRFYIEHSYFDKASDAYGNTSTFGKVAYTATFIGMSTLMGAALNLAALFALVSIAIAYLTSVLLSNHHTISFARSARLEADIIEMEETNKAQFEEFSLLEDKLNEALVNLNYKT